MFTTSWIIINIKIDKIGIKKISEDNKIAIRSIRRDGIEEFKAKQKASEIV